MKPWLRPVLAFAWTIIFLVPTTYVCLWAIESFYEVPLDPESFRFERWGALFLMPAALLVFLAQAVALRNTAPRLKVSRGHDLSLLRPGFRVWLRDVPTGLRISAVVLLVFALMGPQSIHARDSSEVEGIDIVLVLDMSLSMQAADIQPNRFEATQAVVQDFIQRRPNDRIGAVVFGKDAYTLMPLTTDKEALRSVIRELELSLIDGRGTAIGNAVGTALNRLRNSQAESKTVILLTDGDSNAGNVTPDQAAELASTMGVQIYTILMGQSGDARVQRGVDLFGRPLWDTASFPVNPELLQQMSDRTGGQYFQVGDRQALEQSFHTILDELEKTEMEDPGRVYGELFPAFVWPAFFLLGLELLLGTLLLRRWP